MEMAPWIIHLKVAVTVLFFALFTGIIAFTYAGSHREALEENRFLPLRDDSYPEGESRHV